MPVNWVFKLSGYEKSDIILLFYFYIIKGVKL